MNFQKALEKSAFPKRIGNMNLGFEPPFFFGQSMDRSSRVRSRTYLLACAIFGSITVLWIIWGAPHQAMPWLLACAVSMVVAILLGQRSQRRRFQLDFANNLLRLDFPSRFRGRPKTCYISFKDIEDLHRHLMPNSQFCLKITFLKGAPLQEAVLISDLEDISDVQFLRVEDFLRKAWGLPPHTNSGVMWEDSYQS